MGIKKNKLEDYSTVNLHRKKINNDVCRYLNVHKRPGMYKLVLMM